MHVFVVASSPPTTSPKPTTTETPSRMRDIWGNGDFNNSVYGNPSSLTVHISDKGIFSSLATSCTVAKQSIDVVSVLIDNIDIIFKNYIS